MTLGYGLRCRKRNIQFSSVGLSSIRICALTLMTTENSFDLSLSTFCLESKNVVTVMHLHKVNRANVPEVFKP